MKGKRILFFVSGSYVSGLEIVAFQLMTQLKQEGHVILCIVNGWNNGVFKSMLETAGIEYYELKLGWLYIKKLLWTLDTMVHLPKAFYKARKIIKDFQPEVIHFHNFSNYLFLYPLIKAKSVYTLHETHLPSKKINLIYKALNKKVNAFVGVSHFIGQCLAQLPLDGSKVNVIYNGIEISPSFRLEKKQKNEKLTIGIVGQVIRHKGHELLIDAIDGLVKKEYDVQIKIFGKANDQYDLFLKNKIREKRLEDKFEWMGFEQNKRKIYSGLDVVVVPTIETEPLSLTKMEAMYYGCPVIVSDKGGNPELVRNGLDGYIFESGNANQLDEKIEVFLNNYQKIEEMGRQAHDFIKNHSVQKMTEEYITLYNKLTAN